ncbi:MAG: YbaK/EbsC family protein [Firmicutes bacterium]|nr:YbaK/EbsC family protein [Bacillota bacterium]
MSAVERVQAYLDRYHPGLKAIEFDTDTSTCETAAATLGVEVGQIAKSLVFKGGEQYVMVVAAGDVRVDTKKLKKYVGVKVKLATPDEVLTLTGYPVGGVCPVALKTPLRIFLDDSLARFDVVYAAAGTPQSALPVTLQQLQEVTRGEIVNLAQD